jgi:DNA-binding transcriptional LysR family regulator
MISLDDAVVFVTLVNAKNLSAAGRRLNMSTAAVSKRISRLEDALKAQLVIRSSRSVTLTEAGSVFFEQCAALSPIMETAVQKVHDISSEPRGTLRIHATVGMATKLIAPLIAEFRETHQDIEVELITHSGNKALIAEGKDLIIGSVGPLNKAFHSTDVGICHYAICASPEYLARTGKIKNPQDLTQHECLLFFDEEANKPVTDWPFAAEKDRFAVQVRGAITSNNGAALTELALKGAGVALLPVFAVFDEIRAGKLVAVLKDEIAYTRAIKAHYPRSAHSPKSVRAFLEFVATHLKSRTLGDLSEAPGSPD